MRTIMTVALQHMHTMTYNVVNMHTVSKCYIVVNMHTVMAYNDCNNFALCILL